VSIGARAGRLERPAATIAADAQLCGELGRDAR
jgi:hypothetical protein